MLCRKCKTLINEAYNFCPLCGASTNPEKKKSKSRRPNGTGYIRKRGKTYQIEITAGKKKTKDGKIIPNIITKGGFLTKEDATAYALKMDKTGKKRKKKVSTLKSLWENFSTGEMLKLSKSKQTHYRTAYSRLHNICDTPISELDIDALQSIIDEETDSYYPARDIKNLLSHLYERAAAQQDVTSNLSQYICLPELEEGEPFPFTKEDIEIFWKYYGNGHKFAGYILLMIYSGMMPGELFNCKKNMIIWDSKQIVGCGLKTKKRKQTPLLIAEFMVPVLQDLCEQSESEYLLPIRRENFYIEFHKTLKDCNIQDRTPYNCRHTTATALALGNVAPYVIQEIMRHSKFSTTERYIHIETSQEPMYSALDSLKKTDNNCT